jgi:2-iminobutanoate/2-iminopropanoate deaminase
MMIAGVGNLSSGRWSRRPACGAIRYLAHMPDSARKPGAALVIFASCLIAGCQRDSGPEVAYLSSPTTANLNLPFSEAVRVGDLLFVSGQIGNLPGTLTLAEGGIQGETRQTLENMKAILEHHGSSMDRVVKCTVYLTDMAEWPAMNEIYVQYFPGHKPARAAAGASALALGAKVEIECIAVVGE